MAYDLDNVTLRSEKTQRIRNLSGYKSHFRLPEKVGDASQKFLVGIAQTELKAVFENDFRTLREAYAYKRKEMKVREDRGHYQIETPDFTYQLEISLNPEDTSEVIWRREINEIKIAEKIWSENFKTHFGKLFTLLLYQFDKVVNLENFIDRLEEKEITGVSLDYDSHSTWCELKIRGMEGSLKITQNQLEITGENLLELFVQFKKTLQGLTQLPLKSR